MDVAMKMDRVGKIVGVGEPVMAMTKL